MRGPFHRTAGKTSADMSWKVRLVSKERETEIWLLAQFSAKGGKTEV